LRSRRLEIVSRVGGDFHVVVKGWAAPADSHDAVLVPSQARASAGLGVSDSLASHGDSRQDPSPMQPWGCVTPTWGEEPATGRRELDTQDTQDTQPSFSPHKASHCIVASAVASAV